MKSYIFNLFFWPMLCMAISGCDSHKFTRASNFNIVVETDFETLDIKNGYFKRCHSSGDVKAKFVLSDGDMDGIFNYLVKNKIFHFPSNYKPFSICMPCMSVIFSTKITIRNNTDSKIFLLNETGNDLYFFSDIGKVRKIRKLQKLLNEIVSMKPSVKSLPLSDCALE